MSENGNAVQYGKGWDNYYTQVPNQLFEERCTLTPIQAMVYLYLLMLCNEKKGKIAWPSHATIANHIRVSPRGVQEATYILKDKGYIEIINRRIEEGPRANAKTSNLYIVNHPQYTKDFKG